MEKGIFDLMNAQTPPPRLPLARSLRTIEKSVRDTEPSGISGLARFLLLRLRQHDFVERPLVTHQCLHLRT